VGQRHHGPGSRGLARGGAIHLRLRKYTRALIAQISQTAVCNRHQSVARSRMALPLCPLQGR